MCSTALAACVRGQVIGSIHPRISTAGEGYGSSFDRLSSDKLGSLVTGRRRVARHARLCREHETLEFLYVVRLGHFKSIGNDLHGEQRVAGFHMTGDWMGLSAIATGRHRLGIIALEDSEVMEGGNTTAVN
jgi:CRP/FNR family transcriptional regulator